MRNSQAKVIALGGMMAALAATIMCLGGLIPVATFVCPIMCIMLGQFVLKTCGRRIGWTWYGAVAILSLLIGPDKEAAAIFAFLGYYPMLKPRLDRMKLGTVLKLVLFNAAILLMYWILIRLFGMDQIASEYAELGAVMTVVMLIGGNVIFFLLDKILGKQLRRKK